MVRPSRTLIRHQKEVLQSIWVSADSNGSRWPRISSPYIQHFNHLTPASRETASLTTIDAPGEVVSLVNLVKQSARSSTSIQDIANDILAAKLPWVSKNDDLEAAKSSLSLILELWLFVEPSLLDLNKSLNDVVKGHIQQSVTPRSGSSTTTKMLSSDFSAKSLTSKAGFHLVWTSKLSEHLMLKGKRYLYVFCHASILAQYQRGMERYVESYPFKPHSDDGLII